MSFRGRGGFRGRGRGGGRGGRGGGNFGRRDAYDQGPPDTVIGEIGRIWISSYTVKPVLVATCIQRPPVLKGHSVMSQRCLPNIF